MPVDALGIVASFVERFEVRIAGWDLTNVLGPVELALPIFVVAVQPDSHDPAADALGLTTGSVLRAQVDEIYIDPDS